jgi:hypothetical protein
MVRLFLLVVNKKVEVTWCHRGDMQVVANDGRMLCWSALVFLP